jgi:hypothetical protein
MLPSALDVLQCVFRALESTYLERSDYASNPCTGITVDGHRIALSNSHTGGPMREIRQALRRKQAQYAQLAKEIAMLQEAEVKLREIAPLLADSDEEEDDENALLGEVEDEVGQSGAPAAKAASAAAGGVAPAAQPSPGKAGRPVALRWP